MLRSMDRSRTPASTSSAAASTVSNRADLQNQCSKEVPLRRVFHVDCSSFVLFAFRDEVHHKTSIRSFISSTGSLLQNFQLFQLRWVDLQHILQYAAKGTGIAAGQVGFYPAPVKNGCFVLFFCRNGVMCVQTLRDGSRLQKSLERIANNVPSVHRRNSRLSFLRTRGQFPSMRQRLVGGIVRNRRRRQDRARLPRMQQPELPAKQMKYLQNGNQ